MGVVSGEGWDGEFRLGSCERDESIVGLKGWVGNRFGGGELFRLGDVGIVIEEGCNGEVRLKVEGKIKLGDVSKSRLGVGVVGKGS